jgi:hypothetical protein
MGDTIALLILLALVAMWTIVGIGNFVEARRAQTSKPQVDVDNPRPGEPPSPAVQPSQGAMRLWVSTDGAGWRDLGIVDDDTFNGFTLLHDGPIAGWEYGPGGTLRPRTWYTTTQEDDNGRRASIDPPIG